MRIKDIKTHINGQIDYYDENNRIIEIKYPNTKYEQREYHSNGVLKSRKFPNGKYERYNEDKQLIYRKYNNEEEIWERDTDGRCIKYTRHVYFK